NGNGSGNGNGNGNDGDERDLCLATCPCIHKTLTCPSKCPKRKPRRTKDASLTATESAKPLMRIGARNTAGYLTEETKKPAPEDPSSATWITENHRVKSWLIDSMSQSLMQQFIRLSTAKDIWEAVSKTFYDGSDETRLFELNQKSFSTSRMEIDHKTTSQERTVEGVVHLHLAMAKLRVHIFLSRIDSEFDQVRGESYERIQSWTWKAHMHMSEENINKGRPREVLDQSLRARLWWPTELSKDPHLVQQKIEIISQLADVTTLFIVIVGKQVTRNNGVIRSLAILNGGTSQRN
ncbi:hypothetical protein RJ639_045816, partial [Escallonia herrerae]